MAMRYVSTACERCGLRSVRCELEQRGIVVRFCDDCYWGEIQPPDLVELREEAQPGHRTPRGREAAA
jgi:hypothetical protein